LLFLLFLLNIFFVKVYFRLGMEVHLNIGKGYLPLYVFIFPAKMFTYLAYCFPGTNGLVIFSRLA
jgi:hypothetical protein